MRFKKDNIERIADTTEAADKLKRKGFQEIGPSAETALKKQKGEEGLTDKSLKELRALAKSRGVAAGDVLTKEELITALEDVKANG